MAVISELIRSEADNTLSFGDYTLSSKTKKDNFTFEGANYKVKTFKEITKLEKDGMFVYESVPGSAVFDFKESASEVTFTVTGASDVQITLELEPDTEYEAYVNAIKSVHKATDGYIDWNSLNKGEIPTNIVRGSETYKEWEGLKAFSDRIVAGDTDAYLEASRDKAVLYELLDNGRSLIDGYSKSKSLKLCTDIL